MASAGGKAKEGMQTVVVIVVILTLFPIITTQVASLQSGGNISSGTYALLGLIEIVMAVGLLFYAWNKFTS